MKNLIIVLVIVIIVIIIVHQTTRASENKSINSPTEPSPFIQLIMDEKIAGLEKLSAITDLNSSFKASKYTDNNPLEFALINNKVNVVKWLISKAVNLNWEGSPSIVTAAANCEISTIELLRKHGADINALDHVGNSAPEAALNAKRIDVFKYLLANGYILKNDGSLLRKAVHDKNFEAVDILVSKGIDVNFCLPDMVFPYNSTPVMVAADNNDVEMVKRLVKHGADVTIRNAYGDRPYTSAFQNKNSELMKYIESLEPKVLHDKVIWEKELANKYYVPEDLIALLKSDNRRIPMHDNEYIEYVEFNPLLLVKEVQWKGYKFLDLIADADEYNNGGFLVWLPEKKCIASADYEHEELKVLGTWDDFKQNPSPLIDKIWE